MTVPATLPSIPRSIGRYEVLGLLATGGMAEIFLARLRGPSGFRRPVVIKRILPHLARQPEFVSMFLDEARIVASIRHPAVVHVEELVNDDAELFIAMEYLEGESTAGLVRRLIARGERLPVALAAHLVAEACAGLHAAHELATDEGVPLGLVHRDVSPQNLFVTYAGKIKLLDFGIAKAKDRVSRTEAGQVKGKAGYMSPEQCLGKPISRASDIFALGTLLYEFSTMHRLFRRPTQFETYRAICEEPAPSPALVVPGYPDPLAAICARALAKAPTDRYPDAAAMRRDLVRFVHEHTEGRVVDEWLSELMAQLFADRMEEKSRMLRGLAAGDDTAVVPPAETDESISVPDLEGTQTAASEPEIPSPSPSPSPSRSVARMGIVLVGLTALLLGMRVWPRSGPRMGDMPTRAIAHAPSADAPTMAPSPTLTAPHPSIVAIAVQTTPPGARVLLNGVDGGTTPVTIDWPRGSSLRLEVRRDGYSARGETMIPQADQRVSYELAPLPKKTRPSPRPAASGFYALP